jgi:hypothetical protein
MEGLMLRLLVVAAALLAATIATPVRAQQLVESYTAYLSEADHFNSNGQRLTSAAAIIRQDRANFHRFGRGDPGDEGDRFFASIDNRAAMERMLERGRASSAAIDAIVNRTPLIRVDIYRDGDGHFIRVTVLN